MLHLEAKVRELYDFHSKDAKAIQKLSLSIVINIPNSGHLEKFKHLSPSTPRYLNTFDVNKLLKQSHSDCGLPYKTFQ